MLRRSYRRSGSHPRREEEKTASEEACLAGAPQHNVTGAEGSGPEEAWLAMVKRKFSSICIRKSLSILK